MKFLKSLFGTDSKKEKATVSSDTDVNEPTVVNIENSHHAEEPEHTVRQADTLKFDAIRAMNMGELVFATEALRKALELRPEFETRYYLTEVLVRRHLLNEALAQMDSLLEEVPSHTATLLNRAKLRLEQNNPSGALEDCRAGIESTSEDEEQALFLYYGASAMRDMQNPQDALCLLKQAIEKNESFLQARLLRARMLIDLERYDEASQDLDLVAASDAEEEQVPMLRARIFMLEGKPQNAMQAYEELLSLDPFNEEGHRGIASLMIEEGRSAEAEKFLREAIEEMPEQRSLTLMLVEILENQGQTKEADEWRAKLPEVEAESEAVNFNDLYKGNLY